jgi:hypothetical protein
MADNLDLLFRIRGDATGAKNATEQARQAVHQLRTSATSDLRQIQQSSTQSLGSVTQSLSQITANIPVVGRAFSGLSNQLGVVATESTAAAGGLAAIAGPATLAVAAVAALSAGVITLTRSFFQLVQQTSEFQGKFFDLSQQVGVSVETLSTLDVVASNTGGNIESVTASLGIFQKNLEAAHDPTSKEAKLLTELGVTSLNTEVALRQVIKGLFDLEDKQKQTSAVLELFGRSGRFMNAILKESKGDLSAATAEIERLGLLTSTEAAVAADQFNDSLNILNRQLSAVTRNLVSQSIPAFIIFFEDINRAINGNKAGWTSWADLIEFEVTVAIAALESFATFVASRGVLGFFDQFEANVRRITQQSRELRTTLQAFSVAERVADLTTGGRVGDRPDAKGGKSAASQAQARAAKEISLAQRALEESTRHHVAELTRERDKDLKSIDEWEEATLKAAEDHEKQQQEIFNREEANARRFIKNNEDLALALIDIQQKRTRAVNQLTDDRDRTQTEAQKRKDQAELDTERQIAEIRDSARKIELDRIKNFVDRGIITESEGIARTLALLQDEQAQRLLLIDIELKQETTSAARKLELDNQKIRSEQEWTAEKIRLTEERMDVAEREAFEAGQRPGGGAPGADIDFFSGIGQSIENEIGLPPEETFNAWKDAFTELKNIGANAMADLAFGVGSLIENWVLLGETGPQAMRKLVASVLAGVAAQAAVKAIYELAEGFAALFVNPAAAAAHFTSAAIFGTIAGVAAIAGRAVAGDSFQRNDRSGGGGSSDFGGSRGALPTIVQGRNQPQEIRIILSSNMGELDRVITASVVRNVGDGGEIREVITRDGR